MRGINYVVYFYIEGVTGDLLITQTLNVITKSTVG